MCAAPGPKPISTFFNVVSFKKILDLDVFATEDRALYYCWACFYTEMTADAATKYSNGNVSVV
jgi:hypothetical protein